MNAENPIPLPGELQVPNSIIPGNFILRVFDSSTRRGRGPSRRPRKYKVVKNQA